MRRNMAQSYITFIDQLDVLKSQFTMIIRIIRLMKHLAYGSSTKTYKTNMILIDEQGRKFETEDGCYYIQNPQLGINQNENSFVDNENKINIYITTKVTPCSQWTGLLYGFSFANFNVILGGVFIENTHVDVIGDVVTCFPMETLMNKKNKLSRRVNLSLEDLEYVYFSKFCVKFYFIMSFYIVYLLCFWLL
uniref:Uncharacterized protein n=1 Tax=Lactuca sativa TaxID=4236 RepID=A0A9R1XXW1_LACSA|nr:hypothetical protein LSAT_V11C100013440 [Lactuca sativa]